MSEGTSAAAATPELEDVAPPAVEAATQTVQGHAALSKADPTSFVQGEMRRVAMKLHTRDQAPKEGQKENKGKKFSEWTPSRAGYLQFLVDSRAVYTTFDEVVASREEYAALRQTGLERTAALDTDIKWMVTTDNQRRASAQAFLIPLLATAGFHVTADNCDAACVFQDRLPSLDYDMTMYTNTTVPDPSYLVRQFTSDNIPIDVDSGIGLNDQAWVNATATMA